MIAIRSPQPSTLVRQSRGHARDIWSTVPDYASRPWRPRRLGRLQDLPGHLQPWVDEPGSLTRRLRAACDDGLQVRVCREAWGRPWRDEARRLALSPGRRVWLREVLLCNGRTPWVHARTLIPESVLGGRLRRLRGLGTRPLGRMLFGRTPLTRGAIEVARIRPGDGLYGLTARRVELQAAVLWARRSLFHAGDRRLLVTEVFLPACHQ